ncbi:hypothetical protein Pint_33486 [Pistacia integerrima]|uniref:Uncharacterized protein n=1 Tax=Pistacia integerrima TaxID=434235 RepID=A0ACC0X5Q7_9ROSI|nr:hypothetical protein Pint_33486 [Pistacia integerrima]
MAGAFEIYVGYSDGALVAKGLYGSNYNLYIPKIGADYYLPAWDPEIPFKRVIISSATRDRFWENSFMLVLTGVSRPAFVFWRGTLAVIEEIDAHLRITALGRKRAVPSISSKHYRECLLVSDAEILLVFLISRKSVNILSMTLRFFSLILALSHGIKKEKLGDRTIVFGK